MTEFVFANFFKIVKKYTNQKYSDLDFMYFLFGKVNKEKDDERTELKLNKSQVSRILNRIDDVPKRVRNYYCDSKNNEELSELFEEYLDERFEQGKEDALLDELHNLYINDTSVDEGVKNLLDCFYEDDYSTFYAEVFKEVLKRNNKLSSFVINIYSKGNTSVNLIVDDLLKIAFLAKYIPGKKIIVIPVDTTFDMQLTEPDECIQHVSEKTLHGKWILKMKEKGKSDKDLNDLVRTSLRYRYGVNDGEYPVGSIAVVRYKETYFYLLAISIFNEQGIAFSNIELFDKAIDSLLSYYNSNGQGYPLYIPLMGTGMTRLNLNHLESYKIIKERIINNIDKLSGNINIIVYTKDKREMERIIYGSKK